MSRWEPNAKERLERAAVELFIEQGFAETTVPQITARAGLTTRSFFRYFADKREVLFAGEEQMPELAEKLVTEAPASFTPMMIIEKGLETVMAEKFMGRWEYLRTRRAVVETDEGLRERDLRKIAIMADALSLGFRKRGLDELTANLTAQIGITVFRVALTRWLDQETEQSLAEIVRETMQALRTVTSDTLEPSKIA